jgi:hypothetical protein
MRRRRRAQSGAKLGVFTICQAPFASTIGRALYAAHGFVWSQILTYGIAENRTKQTKRAAGDAASATHPGNGTGTDLAGRALGFAVGNRVHELLNVGARDGGDRKATDHRLDVALDHATVSREGAGLLGPPTADEQPSFFGVSKIAVAQFTDCQGVSRGVLFGGWIAPLHHIAEQAPRLLASSVRRPRRAVPADGLPPLPPTCGPVFQDIGHRVAGLPPCAEAGHCRVPGYLARL